MRWDDMVDSDVDEVDAPGVECKVGISNLPLMIISELEQELQEEVCQFWKVSGLEDAPWFNICIDAHSVVDSWANKAKGATATLTFGNSGDAGFLIQTVHSGMQSLQVRGRRLTVVALVDQKLGVPVKEIRKLTHCAASDFSSEVSYETKGSKRSHSTLVRHNATQGKAQTPELYQEDFHDDETILNRTILLTGIPMDMKESLVVQEITEMLRKAYAKDRYTFDPSVQFHKGSPATGIVVSRPQGKGKGKGQENGGQAYLKLRKYAHARWIQSEKSWKIGSAKITARWAVPRKVGCDLGTDKAGNAVKRY
jgi:hypothetical protein